MGIDQIYGIDPIYISVFAFIMGTIFGSFYNVVIYRLPMELSIAEGRSMCFSCKHSLGFLDLIPLFSYLFLGGKCRYCKSKFSIRYFLIELITGILFLISYLHFGLSLKTLLMIVFWSMLLIVAMIDIDTMSIYDIVLIVFSGASLIIIVADYGWEAKTYLLGAAVGFLIYYMIYIGAKLVYKQEAFGFGDVLLNGAIGLVLGFPNIILQSFLSFFVSLFFVLIFAIIGKKIKLKQEIPFGPYMCISAIIISLYGDTLIRWYLAWF